MKNSVQSVRSSLWAGLFVFVCFCTGCNSAKISQVPPANASMQAANYSVEDAPQAAQSNEAINDEVFSADEPVLTASSEPVILEAVAKKAETTLAATSQNPKLSRKVAKLMDKVQNQSLAGADEKTSATKQVAEKKFAKKLLAKAEKKFDIMKAKQGNAAQANATLIGLGALLAIVGLVLVLATSGTAATIGVVSLVAGVVLLIISLISN